MFFLFLWSFMLFFSSNFFPKPTGKEAPSFPFFPALMCGIVPTCLHTTLGKKGK